jgi:hypothetical protein
MMILSKRFDLPRPMRRETIPYHDDRSLELPDKILKELNDQYGIDIGIRMKPEI